MNLLMLNEEEMYTMTKQALIGIIKDLQKQIKQMSTMDNRSQSVYEIYKGEYSDSEVFSNKTFSLSEENQPTDEVKVVTNPSSLMDSEEDDVVQNEPINSIQMKVTSATSPYIVSQSQTLHTEIYDEDSNEGVKQFMDDFDSYKSQMFLYGISEQNNKAQQDTLLLADIMKQIKARTNEINKLQNRLEKLQVVIKKHDKNLGILKNNQKYFINVMNKKNLIQGKRSQFSLNNE